MLEQAPASTVTLPLECVSPRDHARAIGRAGRHRPGPAARANAWITILAAALLTLGSGCSLLLDFDVPLDAAPPDAAIDAAPPDAAPVDAAPVDAALIDAAPPDGSTGTVLPSPDRER